MTLIPVIISGGAGTRLWPVSRESHPKPFIKLADGQSLLQKTFLRAAALPGVEEVYTVTNRDFFFKTEDDYAAVNPGKLSTTYLLEPFGRNTAAAVAAAALHAESQQPDAVLLVMPADHLIHDQAAFATAVQQAAELARDGWLVTFGIEPEAPDTGFGYIEADGHKVKRFVEKPDLDTARGFLQQGGYYWNSGMFCFTPATILREMQRHCAEIVEGVQDCLGRSRRVQGEGIMQVELDARSFAHVHDQSIDYAVAEKSDQVAIVPCNIGWTDIGSWTALSNLLTSDANGNRIDGDVVLHDVKDCAIHGEQRLIGAAGVQGLIIVDTPDALLVVSKDNTQDVRQLYAALKARGHDTHKLHRTVHRPWGTYTVLEEGPQFKIKRIEVKPGASLSLQMHHHRSEHWVVVSGTAKIINGEDDRFVRTNESTFIPPCTPHRLMNPGKVSLVMIEVQSGDYLGEDDIVRFADAYGRVAKPENAQAAQPA
ncbi:mannose-1-phosphate guanylyltransferase/mannose-6-phosphate isomerase [Thiomonas delicata]|uniref:mannose-1-phosphate guanylyltransferase n=1 Tax=Thiomonas delicata TaxID=364030 RepID=A0A238D9L2_THIDL|nr:mannose-1-phosphate guanylyltransferase/mannose-6-phosphate isomerase [Thiomonas delicata]SBP89997.1 Alginate biosynthesis protein AlgA (Includes: Mannose-6-phosphate isomerase; Mannose-1-phosphate guanylyltransferase) [Thiomonas delicata]